jgi:hypothetical protein
LRELYFAPALRRSQESTLECTAISLSQLAAHIGIDQICFGRIQRAHVVPVSEGSILHSDLFLFRQVP